jgi:hypothetical protein
MGLTSAEDQKQECFNEQQIIFYKYNENIVNPHFSSHAGILSQPSCISLRVCYDPYGGVNDIKAVWANFSTLIWPVLLHDNVNACNAHSHY